MSRKQGLLEQYEDALFAVLMDEVAQEEGRKALEINEQLKDDPDAAVPDVLFQRCQKTIQRSFSSNTRKKTGRILWKAIHVASIIVLILAATLTISFAASPALRMNILNMVLDIYETHTDFSFVAEKNDSPKLDIAVGWLPEGFELTEDDSNPDSSWKTFENTEGASIHIKKSIPVSMSVDTENAQIEEILIQGHKGTLVTKYAEAGVIWLNEQENIVYHVIVEKIPVDVMLEIAKNIS